MNHKALYRAFVACVISIATTSLLCTSPYSENVYGNLRTTLVRPTKTQDVTTISPTETEQNQEPGQMIQPKAPQIVTMTKDAMIDQWITLLEKQQRPIIDASAQYTKMPFATLKKLHILCGPDNNPETSVLAKLQLNSVFGTVATARSFAQLNRDLAALEQDQELVKFLIDRPDVFAKITQAFEKISEGQIGLLAYFAKQTKGEQKLLESLFYGVNQLDNNTKMLGIMRGAVWASNAAVCIPPLAKAKIQNDVFLGIRTAWYAKSTTSKLQELFINTPARFPKNFIEYEIQSWNPRPNVYHSSIFGVQIPDYTKVPSAGDFGIDLNKWIKISPSIGTKIGLGLTAFAWTGKCFEAYQTYNKIMLDNALFEFLQTRLMGVARIVEGLEIIASLGNEISCAAFAPIAQDAQKFLRTIAPLTELLHTATFKGNTPSFFSYGPNILAAHNLMETSYKNLFVPALDSAGNFETFYAAARLYLNNQNDARPVCLVQFSANTKPLFVLEDFSHPLLSTESAIVKNSLKVGDGYNQNIICTGSNWGGKSATLEAFMMNIITAYALKGVTFARAAVLTPVDFVNLFVGEREDITTGQSSMTAQQKKLQYITNTILSLEPGQRGIAFADEPIGGATVAGMAEELLMNALRKIGRVDEHCLLLTTHFEQLTSLEEETKGRFSNYFVQIFEPEMGNFTRTFKLQRGVDNAWFSDQAKQRRYITWLAHMAPAVQA